MKREFIKVKGSRLWHVTATGDKTVCELKNGRLDLFDGVILAVKYVSVAEPPRPMCIQCARSVRRIRMALNLPGRVLNCYESRWTRLT